MPDATNSRRQCGVPTEIVQWCKESGLPLTEYGLRLLIRQGKIPVRRIGKKQIIYLPNVVRFLTCADGADNGVASASAGGIRRIDV